MDELEFEEEEEGTGSKLFVILAVALIGLLVLGLLGIGGVFVIRQNLEEQAALAQPSPTIVINLPNATPTATTARPTATNTPIVPTPTNTPVFSARSGGEEAAVGGADEAADADEEESSVGLPLPNRTGTPAPGASAAATPSEVPNTGLGAFEAVLIGLAFLSVLLVARRMRMTS